MEQQQVATPVGTARLDWYRAEVGQRAVLVLGHGTATGVEARDLQALARALPPLGVTVILVTQPYRVEHNPQVADEQSLDRAWEAIWPTASSSDALMVAGGRSAGSQVACRTARRVGAHAVLALAYPLLGPGSAAELLNTGRPTLVVQGERDPFGRPDQFPAMPLEMELVAIPSANHMLLSESSASDPEPLARVTDAVIDWLERQLRSGSTRDPDRTRGED